MRWHRRWLAMNAAHRDEFEARGTRRGCDLDVAGAINGAGSEHGGAAMARGFDRLARDHSP